MNKRAPITIQSHYFLILPIVFFCFFLAQIPLLKADVTVPPNVPIQPYIDNSVTPGENIYLSAGTYIEEIQIISKSLNLIGAGSDAGGTIIQAPDSSTHLTQNFTYNGINFWCVVMVDNQAAPTPQTVNISNLTINGSNQQDAMPIYGNPDRFFALGYYNADGTVTNVHTTSTRQFVNFNELAGGGIICAADTGAVTCNITNCLIDFYQRSGIDCRGAALTSNITGTTVNRGYVSVPNPSNPAAAPNGIQYSGLTVGTITNNIVNGNISTVANASSSGIIPFGTGPNVVVSGNILDSNDGGIAAIECGDNLTISNNTLSFSQTIPFKVNIYEGIIVQDTSGLTTITSNVMNNIPDVNMDISTTVTNQPFQLMNNQFNGSQTGMLVTGLTTAGPQITMNSDSFTGTVGYYIQEVTAPNDIWPSTDTVSFDGLVSGHITFAQFNEILTKIYDKHNDPTLGLVLDFIAPMPPTLTMIDATSGPTTGGNTVTITGNNFLSSDTTVYFGSVQATNVVVVSDTMITATAPSGTGLVDVTVMTLFGTTPIVPEDRYTYVVVPPTIPLPPSNFVGVLQKNKYLNKTEYVLEATWDPSPSLGVMYYLIYNNGRIVDEVPATSPLVFTTCVTSRNKAHFYQIVAVNSANVQSLPIFIRINHD